MLTKMSNKCANRPPAASSPSSSLSAKHQPEDSRGETLYKNTILYNAPSNNVVRRLRYLLVVLLQPQKGIECLGSRMNFNCSSNKSGFAVDNRFGYCKA